MTETEDFNVTEIRCSDLHPVDPDSTISGQAHATAVNQFLESEGLSDGKKKRKRFLRMSPEAFAVFRLNNAIAKFCKNMDIEGAFRAYTDSKSSNIFPSTNVYANLLSLTAGFGDQGSGSGPPRESDPPSNFNAAFQIYSDMRERRIPFLEASYTAMIRCFCLNHKSIEAMALYDELKSKLIVPKLRTFYQLLKLLSTESNESMCFLLYRDMTETYKLIPTEREYNCMLSVLVAKNNPKFFNILLSMMDDIYRPSHATWEIVKQWFLTSTRKGKYVVCMSKVSEAGVVVINGDQLQSIDICDETRKALLNQVESLATTETVLVSERSMSTLVSSSSSSISRALKDSTAGDSNAAIRTTVDEANLINETIKGADSSSSVLVKSGRKFHKAISQQSRQRLFDQFKSWVLAQVISPNHEQKYNHTMFDEFTCKNWKFDVIVDGANVGYFKQNYANAPSYVDYQQIDWMLTHLKELGYQPLLILHCRHLNLQYLDLPQDYIAIIDRWKRDNILFVSPAGCNDDWYWLYAAVYWRCKLISNDEMRDHHFQMLSPRWFGQWKERHQVHFKFGDWCDNASSSDSKAIVAATILDGSSGDTLGEDVGDDCDEDDGLISADELDPADLPYCDHKRPRTPQHSLARAHDNTNKRLRTSSKKQMWRRPILSIPSPYSFRTQYLCSSNASDDIDLNGNNVCGTMGRLYFPPPEQLVTDLATATSAAEDVCSSQESFHIAAPDTALDEWLCIYPCSFRSSQL